MDRTPVQMTAAVPHLDTVEMLAPVIPAAPRPQLVPDAAPKRPAERPSGPGFQSEMFGLVEAKRPAGAVVSPPAQKKSRPRRDLSQQQTLQLSEVPKPQQNPQSALYCERPIALTAHRVLAAAIDMAIVLAALGVFLMTFRAIGADLVLSGATVPYYAAAAGLIAIFYRALFCIADFDTPGLSWTGLTLITLDGRKPTPRNRWLRLLGGFVSTVAVGIGLLWALVDDEKYTWHDRISTTFPVPIDY